MQRKSKPVMLSILVTAAKKINYFLNTGTTRYTFEFLDAKISVGEKIFFRNYIENIKFT
jgi:hypothetical protein